MKTYYKPGSWNAICDSCGFKFKAEDLKLRWDGARVCDDDWEPRHPADLIRIPKDNPAVPWSRPELEDVFIGDAVFLTTESGELLLAENGDQLYE